MTVDNGFHPRSNADRLYVSRCKGSEGLIGVQDTVETFEVKKLFKKQQIEIVIGCMYNRRR